MKNNNNNNMFLALSAELLIDPFAAERSGFNDTLSWAGMLCEKKYWIAVFQVKITARFKTSFIVCHSSIQFSSIQFKNFDHPTGGNFVVVMAGS